MEKNLNNSEKKIVNLNNKIKTLLASNNEIKTERNKLTKEIERLQNNPKMLKVTKSFSTQTDDGELNNNLPTDTNTFSEHCETYKYSKPSLDSLPTTDTELFKCFVCDKVFFHATKVKEHAEKSHNIELNLDKLNDSSEEDAFVRYVKSIVMESDYLNKRKKLYPDNWDHVEERIKIRMLAQKKLEICSWHIEENIREINAKNVGYPRRNDELAEV